MLRPHDLACLALASVHRARRQIGRQTGKQPRCVHRVKTVLRTTKVAAHFHLPLFGDDALHLFGAQAADHVAHTFAVAAAGKAGTGLTDEGAIQMQTFQPCVGWVVVLNGELRGRDFRLVDGKNTLGTAADCDVVLTDPYLSSHHAVIRHENGEFTLVDLDSTNGTYVNERRVSREDLIDNDKVRLGRSELKFKSLE